MDRIDAVCISPEKRMIKKRVDQAVLETNWDINGDARDITIHVGL